MIYEQDEKITLYALFVKQDGSAATITGTPTVSIYHAVGSSVKTDVNAANMTLASGTLYYYEFYINAGADKTNYIAKYSASYDDGTSVIYSESFYVVQKNFYSKGTSGGIAQKTVIKDLLTKEERKTIFEQLDKITAMIEEMKAIKEGLSETRNENDRKVAMVSNELSMLKKQVSSVNSLIEKSIDSLSKDISDNDNKLSLMPDAIRNPVINALAYDNSRLKSKLHDFESLLSLVHNEIKSLPTEKKLSGIEERLKGDKESMEIRLSAIEEEMTEIGKIMAKFVPIEE